MTYYVCKDKDGNLYTQGAKNQKLKEAICHCPLDDEGNVVTDINFIKMTKKGPVFNASKKEEALKTYRKNQINQQEKARMSKKAREYLETVDISKVKTMAETQEVLFNILRIMGIK